MQQFNLKAEDHNMNIFM